MLEEGSKDLPFTPQIGTYTDVCEFEKMGGWSNAVKDCPSDWSIVDLREKTA